MQYLEDVACVTWGEAEALMFGSKQAKEKNITSVILEGDYADVTNRLIKPCEDVTLTGFRLQGCKRPLDSVDNCTVKWCQRNCNKVANMLSKIALENNCNLFFDLDYLIEIQNLVIFDQY